MTTQTSSTFKHIKKPHYSEVLKEALEKRCVNAENRIIRLKELKARVSLSRSSIYALMKAGEFPLSFSLGSRSVGWDSLAIDAWIDSRISASRKAT